MVAAMNAPHASAVVCAVLLIEHASLAEPLRFTNNGEDIEVDGDTYTALAFDVELPSDVEEAAPTATLLLDNTSQALTPLLRSVTGELTVTVKQVRCTARTTPPEFEVEMSFLPFKLAQVDMRKNSVRATLNYGDSFNTEFPADDFNPVDDGGMF